MVEGSSPFEVAILNIIMSILAVRDRIATILSENTENTDDDVTIYTAGIVPREWIEKLGRSSTLPDAWLLKLNDARRFERQYIWPELKGDTSVLIVAQTKRSNLVGFPMTSQAIVHLSRPSVKIIQIASHGKNLRPDLQGKTITTMKAVKDPVDIDAL